MSSRKIKNILKMDSVKFTSLKKELPIVTARSKDRPPKYTFHDDPPGRHPDTEEVLLNETLDHRETTKMLNHKTENNHISAANNINLDPVEVKPFVKKPHQFVPINVKILTVCIAIVLFILLLNTVFLTYKYYECQSADTAAVVETHQDHEWVHRVLAGEKIVAKQTFEGRLPTAVKPFEYKVKLLPFIIEGNFTFAGEVWIKLEIREPTNNITLHMKELTILEHSITQLKGNGTDEEERPLRTHEVLNETRYQFMVFTLKDEMLTTKHTYELYVKYTGQLNNNMRGLYRSSYTRDDATRWIVASQFQATDARRAFPCFDEPSFKAVFTVIIGRWPNMTSLSNMPLDTRVPRAERAKLEDFNGTYVWDYYTPTCRMSTYLLAVTVMDFASTRSGADNALFQVTTRPEFINQTAYIMAIGPRLLEYFASYFDYPYPLTKTDLIALPDFNAGAMENFGLITFRENSMLYDEQRSSSFHKQRVATIVSHELAHQWFGNLVTLAWWNDLWLNEGFASYIEYFGVNAVEPSWKIIDIFVVEELQNVFGMDALKSSHPVQVEVNNLDEITEIFDKISYSKGSSLLRMADHFLTNQVLKYGLHNYIKTKAYNSSTSEELWEFLTDAGHHMKTLPEDMNISIIMNTWTLQTGFPVITVTRDYSTGKALVEQKRFLLEPNEAEPPHASLWWVPLTFNTQSRPKFNITKPEPAHWLRAEPSLTLSRADLNASADEWVIFNSQETGYYRVQYDARNWALIIRTLRDRTQYRTIHLLNRAQLLDDAMNLARAGLLDYRTALNVTSYLRHETELVPWRSALNALSFIETQMYRKPHFQQYKKYVLYIIEPLYNSTSFDHAHNADQMTIYKNVEVLKRACSLGMNDCVRRALHWYSEWMYNPSSTMEVLPVNLKSIVLCTGVRYNPVTTWEDLWEKYMNLTIASEKDIYLSALACSAEYSVLSRFLELAITENSPIRKQDAPQVFSRVSQSPLGHTVTLDFLFNNWERIKTYFNGTQFQDTSIIKFCTKKISSEVELNQLITFVKDKYKDLGSSSRTIWQIIENAKANVKWSQKNYQTIVDWLDKPENYMFPITS